MPGGGEKVTRRASPFETLGAWLRLWTPPRDVEVPPVPVRKLALWGVGVLVVAAAATAVIAPRIDDAKDRARRRATRARPRRAARPGGAETIAQQRPRSASAAGLRPDAGAPAARRLEARAALLTRAEEAISADARARARAGELRGAPGAAECDPYPPRDRGLAPRAGPLGARRGVYDCLVLLRQHRGHRAQRQRSARLPVPRRRRLRRRSASPGAGPIRCRASAMVPDPRLVVELPRACRARQ